MIENITFLLNGLSMFAVAIITFYIYFIFQKKKHAIKNIGEIIGLNGIFYLVFSFLNIFWAFNISKSATDFVLLHTALIVISAVLILYAIYKITNNKNLIYLFLLYLTDIFAIIYSINAFILVSQLVSYLLMTIVFVDIIVLFNSYLKKAGYLGIAYTVISGVLLLLIHSRGIEQSNLLWFIPHTIMFFIFLFLFLGIKKLEHLGVIKSVKRKKPHGIRVLLQIERIVKLILFISAMCIFILFSTISIHEVGHTLVAQFYNCEYSKAVIYDLVNPPHTEIRCSYYNEILLTLGGIIITTLIGLVFLVTGNRFTVYISWLIISIGFLISRGDLIALKISNNIILSIIFLSYICIIISILKLSSYYLKQENVK